MFTGIDIGGTNTDIAVVRNHGVETVKISNDDGLSSALLKTESGGRLAISTSQPLNSLIMAREDNVCLITIPGPGLVRSDSVKGAVTIRGDILEDIDADEILKVLKNSHSDYLAISGKFSIRNPVLEEKVRDIALEFFEDKNIALSHYIGRIGFPSRIAATRLNARIRGVVLSLGDIVNKQYPQREFFFMKGDGGLISSKMVFNNPSVLYNSSNAAAVLGSSYLTGIKDALVVDIGGTTTDFVSMKNGMPEESSIEYEGINTGISGIRSFSIPYGGDSVVEAGGLLPFRIGPSKAFGGYSTTLTDALNACGHMIGNFSESQNLNRDVAQRAVSDFYEKIEYAISVYSPKIIVASGYLSSVIGPGISEISGIKVIVPEHAACVNAVGVAVSKVSLSLNIHYDGEKGKISVNGELKEAYENYRDDDELIEICMNDLRKKALEMGSSEEDCEEIVLRNFRSYDVVRDSRITGRIVDLALGIRPGISSEAP